MNRIKRLTISALSALLLVLIVSSLAVYAQESPPGGIYWNPEDGVTEDDSSGVALPPSDDWLDADNLPPSLLRNVRHNEWVFRGGNYFFYVHGWPHEGWVRRDSQWFFLNPRAGQPGHASNLPIGAMRERWMQYASNHWYFLNPRPGVNGHNSSFHHGGMFHGGPFLIDNEFHQFNANGRWQGVVLAPVGPAITVQPQSITRTVGQTAVFTVGVNRPDLNFRWYWRNRAGNFVPVIAHHGASGVNNQTLFQTNVLMGMNGWTYRVVVSDSQGRDVQSNIVTLTVVLPNSNINGDFVRPMARATSVTSEFGWRTLEGVTSRHDGMDIINGHVREPILAVAAGDVVEVRSHCIEGNHANNCGGWGNYVLLMHNIRGVRYYTVYAHLSTVHVSTNSRPVEQTQVLGLKGNTGNSRGIHLHFELRQRNIGNPINPRYRINFPNYWSSVRSLSNTNQFSSYNKQFHPVVGNWYLLNDEQTVVERSFYPGGAGITFLQNNIVGRFEWKEYNEDLIAIFEDNQIVGFASFSTQNNTEMTLFDIDMNVLSYYTR